MPEFPSQKDEGNNNEKQKTNENQYSKRVLLFVLCVGIGALILGGVQLRKNIKNPFNLLPSVKTAQNNLNKPNNDTLLALQAKDTDKDGLSDYDELYVYQTSPYIADSDSDGISDKDEVTKGTNPNCPEGKTCGIISANSNANLSQNTNSQSATNSGQVTAAQLRQALLAAGVSQTDLDAVDDATLLQNYQAIVAEEQTQNSNTNQANVNSGSVANSNVNSSAGLSVETLQNLSPSEIRTFLKLGGVDEAILNKYDDATLKAVYLQAIQETLTNANANVNSNVNG